MTGQRSAQYVAELLDDPRRRLVAVSHQHRDSVQRVEEEVRIELRLERLEAGAGQLLRETCQLYLALAGLVEVANGVLRADDREIHGDTKRQRDEDPADEVDGDATARRQSGRIDQRLQHRARTGPGRTEQQ